MPADWTARSIRGTHLRRPGGCLYACHGRPPLPRIARSELILQQVKLLSATAASASGVAQRYKVDGQELDRVGVTYLLRRAETGWKIIVLVLHDTDGVVRRD